MPHLNSETKNSGPQGSRSRPATRGRSTGYGAAPHQAEQAVNSLPCLPNVEHPHKTIRYG